MCTPEDEMDATVVIAAVGAALMAYIAFETALRRRGRRPDVAQILGEKVEAPVPPTWQAILAGLVPDRIAPWRPGNLGRVRDLIRRSGYHPYPSEGAFQAAAVRTFAVMAVVGLVLAAITAANGLPEAAVFVAAAFLFVGLRRPYTRMRNSIRRRAEAMPYNMLPVLSSFDALVRSGVAVQEALRRAAHLGGPFSNLMLFFLGRLAAEETPSRAVAAVRSHVPDPHDPFMERWLNMLEAHFVHGQPLGEPLEALLAELQAHVAVEAEQRASVALRRAGLYGIAAVVGMMLTLILPALAVWQGL